jgi:hypothetical protein
LNGIHHQINHLLFFLAHITRIRGQLFQYGSFQIILA